MHSMRRASGIGAMAVFAVLCGSAAAQHVHPQTCIDLETKLGYRGFKHCEYHALYQAAFKNWNCHCYAGQCRPTEFRVAPVSEHNPVGLEVYINGYWFPVPADALRKERAHMPAALLQWMSHACANDPTIKDGVVVMQPHIECVWINSPS